MKTLALALALSFAIPSFAFAAVAQDPAHKGAPGLEQGENGKDGPRGHDGHQGRGGEFGRGLELSPEQADAARKSFKDSQRDRFEITKKYLDKLPEADRHAMRAELKKSRNEHHDVFVKLLTPEQKAKAEAIHKEHKEHKNNEDGKPPVAK